MVRAHAKLKYLTTFKETIPRVEHPDLEEFDP
jgi:hypothetical protein